MQFDIDANAIILPIKSYRLEVELTLDNQTGFINSDFSSTLDILDNKLTLISEYLKSDTESKKDYFKVSGIISLASQKLETTNPTPDYVEWFIGLITSGEPFDEYNLPIITMLYCSIVDSSSKASVPIGVIDLSI